MKYGCIGEHLSHSFSAPIHRFLGDYDYTICQLPREALGEFMTRRDFLGINVTIPYKAAVIPYLDEISPLAKEIGAVNTVVHREGRLWGYNTDFDGMQALIHRIGVPLAGKKVAVLGSGGTGHTACALAKSLGAHAVLSVSREKKAGCITYEELYAHHADTQYIINTTPRGMYPYDDGREGDSPCAVELDRLPGVLGLADAVYNPLRPMLVLSAKRRGIRAEGGLYMLVAQAVRASELFLDTVYPEGTLDRVMGEMVRTKENLVLIGMPGSGKSTVGGLLAQCLHRPLLDTDRLIEEKTGTDIPTIFRTQGEPAFRAIEREVIREVSQQSGAVIATGGGAVLWEENMLRLSRNGCICFLDRPLHDLLPTPDRPTASTREEIARRYAERYEAYLAAAHLHIPVCGSPRQVAEQIESEWKNR